jgi:hypothetical protein
VPSFSLEQIFFSKWLKMDVKREQQNMLLSDLREFFRKSEPGKSSTKIGFFLCLGILLKKQFLGIIFYRIFFLKFPL